MYIADFKQQREFKSAFQNAERGNRGLAVRVYFSIVLTKKSAFYFEESGVFNFAA